MIETDIIIIGAGASALLLLQELHSINYRGSVTVLERQIVPNDDRIWSFWCNQQLPDYLLDNIDYQWPSWRFSSPLGWREMRDTQRPYCSIRAQTLRTITHEITDEVSSFSIVYGCEVNRIDQQQGQSLVISSKGKWLASQIIDTRPPPLHRHHCGLFQCFLGIEIETAKDTFDPASADLMEQIKATQQGLEFVYTLPFSKRHALIELTYFSTSPIAPETLKSKLYTIIQLRTNNQSFSYVSEEMGTLPMYSIDLNKAQPVPRYLYGGIAGGAMRASTGYSFLNSQRWANDLAGQIISHQPIRHRSPIPVVYHILDALFLRVQRSMPALGMSLYSRLFQSLDTKTFINFMSEQASLLEILRVIWAMPKRLFMKTLVQSYYKPPRSIDE